MNWLLGLGGLWDKLDGAKTYISGSILLLSGTAGLLGEVLKLVADKNVVEAWNWAKGLPADQYILTFAAGLAAVGLRHAIAKTDAAPVALPNQP